MEQATTKVDLGWVAGLSLATLFMLAGIAGCIWGLRNLRSDHFAAPSGTTSMWPVKQIGFASPLPMRAMRLVRPSAYSWYSVRNPAPSRMAPRWRAHAANPLKTDVRSARPAGTPFRHNGRLFRPAQDCSDEYGRRVSLCEITALDPVTFEETVVRSIDPSTDWPYRRGLHTIAGFGDLTVIDAKTRVFDRWESAAEMRARIGRLRG